jgi:rhodanese-related sulfurtransferase
MNILGRRALFVLVAMTSLDADPILAASKEGYVNIGTAELETLIERGVKVVDVRTHSEWRDTGVIPGSHLITAFDRSGRLSSEFLPALQAAVGQDEEVVLIDWRGGRSLMLAQMLSGSAGYRRVYNAEAGIKQWIRVQNPVQPCCAWSTAHPDIQ